MNSQLPVQLGDWQLGQTATVTPLSWIALGQPTRSVVYYSPTYSGNLNSTLGVVRLGLLELGQVTSIRPITTPFTGYMHPVRGLSYIGGYPGNFNAVLGIIQLGIFELGQTPRSSLIAPIGSYIVAGLSHPIRQIRPGVLQISFEGDAYPIRDCVPNLGPLFAKGLATPVRSLEYIFYYSTMTFEGLCTPTRTVRSFTPFAFVGLGHPKRVLSPQDGQQVSCLVGDLLDSIGAIVNGTF